LLSDSKPQSIKALKVLGRMQQHYYFQYVTEYPYKSLEFQIDLGQKVDNFFHRVGTLPDQIATTVDPTAQGLRLVESQGLARLQG
jgi:hypothetical protein